MGGRRVPGLVVVLALVVATGLLAGCVASKEDQRDQVLRSWNRDKPSDATSEVQFTVAEGTERLKWSMSTKPPKNDNDWDFDMGCQYNPYCDDQQSSGSTSGRVKVTLWGPGNIEQDSMELNYDASETSIIPNPDAGRWRATIRYFSYEGPVALTFAEPAGAGGADGLPFWDVLGVVLGVGTVVGGVWLYRRRARSLSREMHRIDAAFAAKSADVAEARANLIEMRQHLSRLLMQRKIEESQYLILEKRIEQYLGDLETPGNRHAADATGGDAGSGQDVIGRFRRTGG